MPQPASRSPRPGLGLSWLVISLVVAAALGLYLAAPDLPRSWLGATREPAELGDAPQVPAEAQATLARKQAQAGLQDLPARPRSDPLPVPEQQAKAVVKPVDTPVAVRQNYADDGKAGEILAAAEKEYRAFRWQQAKSTALKVADLGAVSPALMLRAKDLSVYADRFTELFKKLGTRDELSRFPDTSPGLLRVKGLRGDMEAVPIASMDDKTPIEEDALAFFTAQRKTGTVTLLIKAKSTYSAAKLPAEQIFDAVAVDVAPVLAARRAEAEARLAELKSGKGGAGSALSWYEVGKHAYRNRADDLVVPALEQAFQLDPNLVQSVREDAAEVLVASMTTHLKNGSKGQALAFLNILNRDFGDTEQARQARLIYEGKLAELVAAARAAEEAKRKAEDERILALKAQREAARKAGDRAKEENLARLEQAKKTEAAEVPADDPVDTKAAPVGDEGKADAIVQQAAQLVAKAFDMPATKARNQVYQQALQIITPAVTLYSKLVNAEKNPARQTELQAKLVQANKIVFIARKYQTLAH